MSDYFLVELFDTGRKIDEADYKKMKVLILNQIPEVNNKYTFSLARGLAKQKIDVRVCGISTDDISAYKDIPFVGCFEPYSNINGLLNKAKSYLKSWGRVLAYCKSEKIEIVHVQWYILSPVDLLYHKKLQRMGVRVVSTIHDLIPFDKKFYDHFFHKKIYQNANWIVSQAIANESRLIGEFKVSKEKISYIPHGHYMEYMETASRDESCSYLNLDPERKLVLFFGQIKCVKGVDVLIDAINIVKEKHPEVLCVIAGKVWKDNFSAYEEQIKKNELENHIRTDIRFIPDSEMKYYFNATDVVVLPYREIYQSGVILLACAYEKPVVATKTGEFMTVIQDKKTGQLVPPGDSHALAESISWVIGHPAEANRMARDCKADISVRLSWDKIAADIKQVYEKMTGV